MKRLLTSVAFAALSFTAAHAQSEIDVMKEDPFLWLEEVEGERALDWVRAQNERSLAILEAHPAYDAMLAEAKAILTSDERVPGVSLRGGYAYNFWQDADHVRGLWRRMPQDAYLKGETEWEILMDLDKVAEDEGENWVYSGSSCLAPDYTRCLVTLSRGGSDAAVVREYDLSTKSFVEDGFYLPEAKSSTAWLDEDTILVGTDFGEGTLTDSGYPRQVKLWKRGQDLSEATLVHEIPQADIWAYPLSFWDGEKYRGGVFHGETFYDYNWLVLDGDTVKRLPLPKKASLSGYASGDYIIELKEPWEFGGETYEAGSVVALSDDMEEASLIIAPTAKMAVQGVSTSEDDVIVSLLDDIQGRVVRFEKSRRGWRGRDVRLPEGGVVGVQTVEPKTGALIVTYENPITPDTYYFVENRRPKEIRQAPAFFDADGMVVQRYEATSKDGTKIPYTIMAKKETLDGGPAPTIQYGYGGFEIPILPTYAATAGKLWAERGGVYVTTNIRGGGEYGPAWHQAGLKGNRQVIYDDFQAISEDMIERGITTKEQLGILGGSNGGLLMGVSMTQRPDLYKGVGIGVPLLDMLRYDKLLAGASWVGEYGDPDNPEERPFLEKISPYHNLRPDVDYPRPFFFTSTKDDRVHPGHARKMARLMEEYGHDFLYYENIEGGHGAAANLDQAARRLALQYAYFAGELGLIDYADEE
ncbi:prolyl oligopeptidase family serine peptidase [Parvularcula lutaonensis]|uniref:Prolyl oligopeptidase family protein n=1 Tax=Parvularcula lutaonensis TaxID=491923 RepID=A0ABV7MAZ5_9PROT|nr:prolyl oligopeptidase family serine peptidase [Parvularcula lutaonensis]GGY46382.1 prolyl oligopeptidase [Parvularcula lutaonensis]